MNSISHEFQLERRQALKFQFSCSSRVVNRLWWNEWEVRNGRENPSESLWRGWIRPQVGQVSYGHSHQGWCVISNRPHRFIRLQLHLKCDCFTFSLVPLCNFPNQTISGKLPETYVAFPDATLDREFECPDNYSPLIHLYLPSRWRISPGIRAVPVVPEEAELACDHGHRIRCWHGIHQLREGAEQMSTSTPTHRFYNYYCRSGGVGSSWSSVIGDKSWQRTNESLKWCRWRWLPPVYVYFNLNEIDGTWE